MMADGGEHGITYRVVASLCVTLETNVTLHIQLHFNKKIINVAHCAINYNYLFLSSYK